MCRRKFNYQDRSLIINLFCSVYSRSFGPAVPEKSQNANVSDEQGAGIADLGLCVWAEGWADAAQT